jgi:hypothetical protein
MGNYPVWKRYAKTSKGQKAIKNYRTSPRGRFAVWQSQLRKLYSLYIIDWAYLFSGQNYCCAGCERAVPETKKGWCVHHTGSKKAGTIKVHGILCHACNIEAKQGTQEHIAHLRFLADTLERWNQ